MPESLRFEEMRGFFNRDGYFFQQTLGRQLLTEPHSHDFYPFGFLCAYSERF